MKKVKYFLFSLFLFIPILVHAETRCIYEVYPEKDNPKVVWKFAIETENNSNLLTKLSDEEYYEIAKNQTIELENGNCPEVVLYYTTWMERFGNTLNLFESEKNYYYLYSDFGTCANQHKQEGNTVEGRCFDADFIGQEDSESQSISSATGINFQMELSASTSDSCTYVDNSGISDLKNLNYKITYSNGDVKANSCSFVHNNFFHMNQPFCGVTFKYNSNEDFFDENGDFSCPEYTYITYEIDSAQTTEYNTYYAIHVVDTGTSDDGDRSVSSTNNGSFDPNNLCSNGSCDISLSGVCYVPTVARTLQFLGFLLFIIKILVPAIIIIMGFINLFKIIIESKPEEAPKYAKNIITRVIIGVIIFLIPTLVKFVFDVVDTTIYGGMSNPLENCTNCILHTEDCKIYK